MGKAFGELVKEKVLLQEGVLLLIQRVEFKNASPFRVTENNSEVLNVRS